MEGRSKGRAVGPRDRTEELLERQTELARLAALAEGARAGSPSLALIEGPAGIGKTRLMEAVCVEAAGQGMQVLDARGAEAERDFGFGAVRQLFEGVLRKAPTTERRRLLA